MRELPSVPPGDYPMYHFIKKYIVPTKRILDIGCGDCTFISFFNISQENYVGIEKNNDRCHLARKKGYHVLCDDVEKLTPQKISRKFDVVLVKDILEHCKQPEQVMRFIHSVLADDGQVFISTPSELSLLIWDDYTHYRGFSTRALKELLDDTGFRLIKLKKDHSLINFHNSPRRYLSLLIFQKLTQLDFITQGYLVHAQKK